MMHAPGMDRSEIALCAGQSTRDAVIRLCSLQRMTAVSDSPAMTLTPCLDLQLWPAYRHMRIWDIMRRYFRMQVVTPPMPVIPPDKAVIVAQFPHGPIPMGYWLSATVIGHSATGKCFLLVRCFGCSSSLQCCVVAAD